jgi:hypothetical protein
MLRPSGSFFQIHSDIPLPATMDALRAKSVAERLLIPFEQSDLPREAADAGKGRVSSPFGRYARFPR